MNDHIRCVLVLAPLLATTSCRPPFSQDQATQSQIVEMKEKWKSKADDFQGMKSFRTSQVMTLVEVLSNAPSPLVESEYRRVCSLSLPTMNEETYDLEANYDRVLLEALITLSAQRKDGSRLVTLLTNNNRGLIGIVPLEYWLAQTWPDSVLFLVEAYGKARSVPVRRELVRCLNAVFPSMRGRVPTDKAFVAEVQAWYKEHRLQLELNREYPGLPSRPAFNRTNTAASLFVLRK
jgi:hypothetical protein